MGEDVLVDVEGGNNLLYLPLDRLTRATPPSTSDDDSVPLLGDPMQSLRNDSRIRNREGR